MTDEARIIPMTITGRYSRVLKCMACGWVAADRLAALRHYEANIDVAVMYQAKMANRPFAAVHEFRLESQL